MLLEAEKSRLEGRVAMPGSKSHTIRALALAALAEGESRVLAPLDSLDTRAAVQAFGALGAHIDRSDPACWRVSGTAGRPRLPEDVIDVGNSGTTLYIAMGTAALCRGGATVLTGDAQIRRRPADRLIAALNALGARVESTRDNGCCPLVLHGPLAGGTCSVEAITSQWVTALLLAAPFGEGDTTIEVPLLHEAPYVGMTLDWLDHVGLRYEAAEDYSRFHVPGGQSLAAFERAVPADFSSATFFLVAGAALDARLELTGLDLGDSQGDKAVLDYLRAMGARIEVLDDGTIRLEGGRLRGAELDLNATPDALPAMAVAAALADGCTVLGNVPQARVKETDRIAVMAAELGRMGVGVRELDDGLVIEGGGLRPSLELRGHGDHRVVMALSLAAMAAEGGPSRIDTAEAVAVTFPAYVDLMRRAGARLALHAEDESS